MRNMQKYRILLVTGALFALGVSADAQADSVTDWNIKAREMVVDAKFPTPHSNRALAIVHTSIYEAVNAITKEYPASLDLEASDDSSIDAAIASAVRVSLLFLMPERKREIEDLFAEALAKIKDSDEKTQGVAIGQQAAQAVWAARKDDGSQSPETYRPYTTAGKYVPTTIPAVPNWIYRKPWMFSDPAKFRPAPPPKLASDAWARDFIEVKKRSEEHTSELQSRSDLVCRLLLAKKNKIKSIIFTNP